MSWRNVAALRLRALRKYALAFGLASSLLSGTAGLADEARLQYFPLATFRVGAYASSGIPVWAGEIDYFRYINEVEGGINGIKLVWDECETNWEVEKGVECYERVKGGKNGSPVPIFLPHGDPISKALTEKSVADKIPLVTIAYGRTEAIDGRVFPIAFRRSSASGAKPLPPSISSPKRFEAKASSKD